MAITAMLVGSLGGTNVQSQSVSFETDSLSTGNNTVATLTAPAGNYRVVVVGSVTDGGTSNNTGSSPYFTANVSQNLGYLPAYAFGGNYAVGISATVTSPGTITLGVTKQSTTSSYRRAFSGTVYWWPET